MKVGILTTQDNDNYGNRLQNYAVQEFLNELNIDTVTLKNDVRLNTKDKFILRVLKYILMKIKPKRVKYKERLNCFKSFNKYINFSKSIVTPYSKISKKYDAFVVGSDQVWKPTTNRLRDVDLLCFAKNNQRVSFAASFGISELPSNKKEFAKKYLETFKAISVREDSGKKIIEDLTGRNDVQVLIDPVMLLSVNKWEKVLKKPKDFTYKKYILMYFLGEISKDKMNEIKVFASENNCEIVNILNKNGKFYSTGPSEFLYLLKNSFLICTDSFHACAFSILYNKPFIVYKRSGKNNDMYSRIETLLDKFNLRNREYNGNIALDSLENNYDEILKILESERKKSKKFIEDALDIDEV